MAALATWKGRYTSPRHIFHLVWIATGHCVGVFGDGDNAAYETFDWREGKLACSDVGFGDTTIALIRVLDVYREDLL